MASNYSDKATGRPHRSAPISAHPAFPAIVALWFAALLGLGSLVLPIGLFERVVSLTGLSSLVPQAAPPLGGTARFVIAFGAAIAGCLGGWLLGRHLSTRSSGLAESHEDEGYGDGSIPARRRDFANNSERRPLSAREELGEAGLDAPADMPPDLFELSQLAEHRTAAQDQWIADREAERNERAVASDMMGGWDWNDFARERSAGEDMADWQDEAEPGEEEDSAPSTDIADRADENLASDMDGVPSFGANQSPEPADAQDHVEPTRADMLVPDAEMEEAAPARINELDTMGLVQLAERLGKAIEKRRAWLQEKAQAKESEGIIPFSSEPDREESEKNTSFPVQSGGSQTPLSDDIEAAEAGDARLAMAEFFGRQNTEKPAETDNGAAGTVNPVDNKPDKPAALRGIPADWIDDSGEDEAIARSLSLPLGQRTQSHPRPAPEQSETGRPAAEAQAGNDEAAQSAPEKKDSGRLSLVSSQERNRTQERSAPKPIARLSPRRRAPGNPRPSAGDSSGPDVKDEPKDGAGQAMPVQQAQRRFDPPAEDTAKASRDGQSPSDSEEAPAGDRAETERALRAALEKLQKMTGAA
ncbi:hypothetical protein D6851_04830 [Altericroceibacterium spongiae]|uniref:Uncharacterized protein n=1 Tax=Altericroceibacterium spongiae TaxID=2320269 RepID=A0A420EPE3_9SPHN|nr:hypothetical protein [Altericroceibacterium spongiae]RKF22546.1 hypothetical protein D6851_04830 [Altericroceibacterium spongiae]